MPAYGALANVPTAVNQPAAALYPGDTMVLFSAEASTDVAKYPGSIAVAIPPAPGGYKPIVFSIGFATTPANNITIQGAMEDREGAYQTLFTSTAKPQDYYSDDGGFKFYRVGPSTSTGGGNVTVTVRR